MWIRDSVLAAWDPVAALKLDPAQEATVCPLLGFLQEDDGATLPFRPPRPVERLRDAGLGDYYTGDARLRGLATQAIVVQQTNGKLLSRIKL